MNPSRHVRRRLERRADRLVERLRGEIIAVPRGSSPRELALLLTERVAFVVRRSAIVPALLELGVTVSALDEILAAITSDPRDDNLHYPSLIFVDGYVQVAFTRSHLLTAGGVA